LDAIHSALPTPDIIANLNAIDAINAWDAEPEHSEARHLAAADAIIAIDEAYEFGVDAAELSGLLPLYGANAPYLMGDADKGAMLLATTNLTRAEQVDAIVGKHAAWQMDPDGMGIATINGHVPGEAVAFALAPPSIAPIEAAVAPAVVVAPVVEDEYFDLDGFAADWAAEQQDREAAAVQPTEAVIVPPAAFPAADTNQADAWGDEAIDVEGMAADFYAKQDARNAAAATDLAVDAALQGAAWVEPEPELTVQGNLFGDNVPPDAAALEAAVGAELLTAFRNVSTTLIHPGLEFRLC